MSLKGNERSYAVIMAGGRGERFWPLSTGETPKPFLPLLGEKSLIQMTVERISPLIPLQRILVVLGKEHLKIGREQLPGLPQQNFLVEPEGKDTAPCIGFASLQLEKLNPEAIMAVIPSDHYIPDQDKYLHSLSAAFRLLTTRDELITLGIKPNRPETGYGYLQASIQTDLLDNVPFLKVQRFIEKPALQRAKRYIRRRDYYWNSGIFVWRNRTIQALLNKYLPEVWQGLSRISERFTNKKFVSKVFRKFPRISIDYGVLEKAKNILLIPAEFRWDDVGTWAALERVHPLDKDGNAVIGRHEGMETKNCIIHSHDHLVATIGVSDLVIVQVNGRLLICPKDKSQSVKEISRFLSSRSRE